MITFPNNRNIYGFSDPILTFVVFVSEIFNCLSLPDMFLPNLVGKLLWSSFILKLFAAIRTLIVLDTSSLSILLYTRIFTVWALFLDMICS